ncbi:MAG: leucine-rich repeat domain-containing protein [Clostridia bacterium]|jgi:hypothetical protein
MKKGPYLCIVVIISLLILCSCDKIAEIPSESISPVISESPAPSQTEVTPTPTQSDEPVVIPTPTATLTPAPTESIPPQRPTVYTEEKYFFFDALHGILLDYDIAGGEYVNIPPTINGVTVTTIGREAFEYKRIYGVILPDTIVKISDRAFYGCGLQEADLGDGIEYIGEGAFYNTRKDYQPQRGSSGLNQYSSDGLTSIVLPDTVKYIGDGAFASNSLTNVTIPNGVEYLSGFSGNCLTSITIPGTVKYISSGAFTSNSLRSVIIPNGVEYLSGFSGNYLTSITIPDTVKYISDGAFASNLLTNVTIPNGVEYLSGFSGNYLTSVTIPDSVTDIGNNAFEGNMLKSVTIPNTIKYIGNEAFKNNALVNVTIPDSVTYIGKSAFLGLPADKIKLGAGVSRYFIINDNSIVGYIGTPDSAFMIPYFEGVTKIADGAFQNEGNISRIEISEGIKYIGKNVFRSAYANKRWHDVLLPDSIRYIDATAFSDFVNHTFECNKGSFTEYLVYGPRYTDRSPLTNHLYSFPLERQQMIDQDISIDIGSEDIKYGDDWIRRYICTKYTDKDITTCNVYHHDSDIYSLTDRSSCEGHTIIAREFQVSLKALKDIEESTRDESGYYRIMLQAVFVVDNVDGRFILSGIIPESEMIDSKQELYDYVKADSRFILSEYIPDPFISENNTQTLSENQNLITTIDLSQCSVISELTKDIIFGSVADSAEERYLPINNDKVVFYLPDPVNKLYIVNYQTNEIIWSKHYPSSTYWKLNYSDRYPEEDNEVFQFYYYASNFYSDYIDTDGKIVDEKVVYSEPYENSISGTKWKAINDNLNVYLRDTETDTVYTVLCTKYVAGRVIEEYRFQKAIDENRFIYQTLIFRESMPYQELYIYDIRDASSIKLRSDRDYWGYFLLSNHNDEYVTSAVVYGGGGSQSTMYIYNIESGEVTDIRDFVDDFPTIVDHALSKDGRYVALLTGEFADYFEIPDAYVGSGIVIIDLVTKEVLIQDALTLNGGSISFLPDNTLVINDLKMLMYIDVSGME